MRLGVFTLTAFQRQNFRYRDWHCSIRPVNYFSNNAVKTSLNMAGFLKVFLILQNLESQLVILQQILHHRNRSFLCFLMTSQSSTAGWSLAALKEEWVRTSQRVLLRQSLNQTHLRSRMLREQWFVPYMLYE